MKRQKVAHVKRRKIKNDNALPLLISLRNTKVHKSFIVPKDINSKSTGKSYEYICNWNQETYEENLERERERVGGGGVCSKTQWLHGLGEAERVAWRERGVWKNVGAWPR